MYLLGLSRKAKIQDGRQLNLNSIFYCLSHMEAQNRDFINIYALKTRQWALIMPLSRPRDRYIKRCALSVGVWLPLWSDRGLPPVRVRSFIAVCMHWLCFAVYCSPVLRNTVNIFVPYVHCVIFWFTFCDDFSPLSVLIKCYLAKLIGIS